MAHRRVRKPKTRNIIKNTPLNERERIWRELDLVNVPRGGDVPATTPSNHTHSTSDISGFSTHTHTTAQVTGFDAAAVSAVQVAGLNSLILSEISADPADPAEGKSVLWQSDGTAAGDDGDIMMKITAGGVTKTVTLVDFSAA